MEASWTPVVLMHRARSHYWWSKKVGLIYRFVHLLLGLPVCGDTRWCDIWYILVPYWPSCYLTSTFFYISGTCTRQNSAFYLGTASDLLLLGGPTKTKYVTDHCLFSRLTSNSLTYKNWCLLFKFRINEASWVIGRKLKMASLHTKSPVTQGTKSASFDEQVIRHLLRNSAVIGIKP